jgi:hypothetical protein
MGEAVRKGNKAIYLTASSTLAGFMLGSDRGFLCSSCCMVIEAFYVLYAG